MLAAPVQARAEVSEADYLDEMPVVLSASRLPQPVNEAPAAVTIIDQDMIRASGFRDIPELLQMVPGFAVAYTRDITWAAGYHGLGDAYSRRFQVLVDGRSIYSAHYGAVNWADLPLSIDDIERIEVVRGPDAAVYGANAFAAVINIISKTPAQVPGEFVSMQVGEENMGGLTVRHGGGPTQSLDVVAYYARVFLRSYTSVKNFNKDIPVSAPRNSWQLLTSYRLGNGWVISVGAWHNDSMKWLSEGDFTQCSPGWICASRAAGDDRGAMWKRQSSARTSAIITPSSATPTSSAAGYMAA